MQENRNLKQHRRMAYLEGLKLQNQEILRRLCSVMSRKEILNLEAAWKKRNSLSGSKAAA